MTPTDATGRAALALPVPNDLSLLSVQVFGQFVVADAGGAWAGQMSVSGGLRSVLYSN